MNGEARGASRRFVLPILLMLAVAPGLWWRSAPAPDATEPGLDIEPVEATEPGEWPDHLELLGVWQLSSSNSRFHGYSALIATDEEQLLAFSDFGYSLRFSVPGETRVTSVFGEVSSRPEAKWQSDVEAATRDPETGRYWISFESSNAIARFAADGSSEDSVRPQTMADWPGNSGPEAMARLANGRFIVLSEASGPLGNGPGVGLIFDADPVDGAPARQFALEFPEGYAATDMATLPDGRVLILLRALDLPLPPLFKGKLVIANPDAIEEGRAWAWSPLADLTDPLPRDNYEGLAIVPEGPDSVLIWLISDDNASAFQRTLLVKLRLQLDSAQRANRTD